MSETTGRVVLVPGLAVILTLLLFGLQGAKPAQAAATFTVNSTADTEDATPDGVCNTCTLREAIQESNALAEADTINFAIPGAGPHTISPSTELPNIVSPVTINGYSESLDEGATPASVNTATDGTTNAVLSIVLSGALAGQYTSGLNVDAPNVVVRGLVVNNWNNYGIDVSGVGSGTRIEGNFIGTDASGTSDQGNRIHGVRLESPSGVTIGGTTPDKRNLISGNGDASNSGAGVEISALAGPAADNKVQGNLIGTDKNGTGDLGNTSWGVLVYGPNNSVGGTDSGAANTIAFNDWDGVAVLFNHTGNRILSNSIFSNGELSIDLNGDGVTANDPRDPDVGSNRLQNFPKLASATTASGATTINGTLNSRPRKTFTIQFFSSPTADPSGNGEGKTFLGQKEVRTNRRGNRPFTVSAVLPAGENVVTATATNNATGDTSEFSGAVTAS